MPGPRDKYIYIDVDTMTTLLRNQSCDIDHVLIVDARYSYEFNGGHLRGAVNIPSQVFETFIKIQKTFEILQILFNFLNFLKREVKATRRRM